MATEKRLIDAESAIERARKSDKIVGSSIWETSEVVMFIEDEPTLDAVEVVRCKDCKHWCTVDCAPNYGSCSKLEDRYREDCESYFDETTRFDDFCSYGERKDND